MKLKKTEIAVILGLILAIVFSSIVTFAQSVGEIRDSVLRLHILAASDSDEDQKLKLKVRDAVLDKCGDIFSNAADKDSALKEAGKALPVLELTARETVKKEGYDYGVKVYITNMYFDERRYEAGTLPAGYYDAVRIVIGEGKGHNWWCIMFPSVCVQTASPKSSMSDVLTSDEEDIVENKGDYEIRFFFADLFERIFLQ